MVAPIVAARFDELAEEVEELDELVEVEEVDEPDEYNDSRELRSDEIDDDEVELISSPSGRQAGCGKIPLNFRMR